MCTNSVGIWDLTNLSIGCTKYENDFFLWKMGIECGYCLRKRVRRSSLHKTEPSYPISFFGGGGMPPAATGPHPLFRPHQNLAIRPNHFGYMPLKELMARNKYFELVVIRRGAFLEFMQNEAFPTISQASYCHAKRSVVMQFNNALSHVKAGIQGGPSAELAIEVFSVDI